MLGSRIVVIRGTYDTYTRRELNEKSSKIRGPGFIHASARSRFAAMRMEFLLFDLGEWLDASVNNYAKAQEEESWQCSSPRGEERIVDERGGKNLAPVRR